MDERGWQWIQARKTKLVEGKPKFDQPETDTVAQKMLELRSFRNKESSNPKGSRMCSAQPLGPKNMEAVLEAYPLS